MAAPPNERRFDADGVARRQRTFAQYPTGFGIGPLSSGCRADAVKATDPVGGSLLAPAPPSRNLHDTPFLTPLPSSLVHG